MQPIVSTPSFDLGPIIQQTWDWLIYIYPHVLVWLKDFLSFLIVISFPISLALLIAIIYCVEQLKVIKKKAAIKYDLKVEPAFETVKEKGNVGLASRWEKVTSLLNSPNQNDWKQAILEADVMLDEILVGLGYQGESIGEKLKRVQPGEFKSIQDAWDAHLVRNRIAHDGSVFQITHHEATRVIHKYRNVFEEFYYI